MNHEHVQTGKMKNENLLNVRKGTMKKRLLAALLTAAMATSLTACGGGSGNGSTADQGFKILISDDTSEGGAMADAAQRYTAETGIKVDVVEVPKADRDTKLANMIQGHDAPALVRTDTYGAYKDQLVDLSDVISAEQFPASLTAKIENEDGALIALPIDVTVTGMLYNKTAFDEAGVSVPQDESQVWSWVEYEQAVKTVTEKSGCKYGLAFDKTQRRYQVLMYQFGASIVSDDGEAVVANSPESVKALDYFVKLHNDGIIPKSVFLGTEDPSALFKAGQLATVMQGSWKISDYTTNIKDFEWGVTYMPKELQRATRLGGNFFCAIQGSGKEDLAKDFLTWFYTPENFKTYCTKGNYMSALNDVTLDYATHPEMYQLFEQELAASGSAGVGDNAWDYSDKVGNLLLDDVCKALNGDMTSQQAMDSFAKEVSESMEIPMAFPAK